MRILSLDFWRFVACIQIAYFHARLNNTFNHKGYLWADFFFILSGFVFFNKSSNLNLKEFIVKRLKRILPLLSLSLIILCLIYYSKDIFPVYSQSSLKLFLLQLSLLNATTLQTVAEGEWNYPTWALSAEFIASILIFLVKDKIHKIFKVLISGLIYFCLIIKLNTLDSYNHIFISVFTSGFMRAIAGILLGLGLKEYLTDSKINFNFRLASVFEILIFILINFVLYSSTSDHFLYDITFLLTTCFLLVVYHFQQGILSKNIVRFKLFNLGNLSLAIFCFHIPILKFIYYVLYIPDKYLAVIFPVLLLIVGYLLTRVDRYLSKILSR